VTFNTDFLTLFSIGVMAWLVGYAFMSIGWILGMALRRLLSMLNMVSDVD